jgi:kynurenine--oxoglutarate transaminase/cysteine-S-conjugate beta-lyase/glutamine--phenylpyruvate transaminase
MTQINKNSPSVWLEFSPLAKKLKAINLGQGFPDWSPPEFLQKQAAKMVSGNEYSVYARSAGQPSLTKAISESYSDSLNMDINPDKNILVTVGASEALYLSIITFIKPGDEVIIFEPTFDIYMGQLKMAGADIKSVSLLPISQNSGSASDFMVDWTELEKTISTKTKAIIINNPHNPTGKVFTSEELSKFESILANFPECLVISDEVYEHLVFDNLNHIHTASLDTLKDRTLSIFSSGKTFSTTGWKIGWVIASDKLMQKLQIAQQWVCFSVATPLQEAIAFAMKEALKPYNGFNTYYEWLRAEYTRKRDLLFNGLSEHGFQPRIPQGSFFIISDISNKPFDFSVEKYCSEFDLQIDHNTLKLNDYNFSRFLAVQHGITTIPMSAFLSKKYKATTQNFIRFAFCKSDELLKEAISKL